MNKTDEKLLEQHGWEVECESPFEIRHEDGSFATGQAAKAVLAELLAECTDCQKSTRITIEHNHGEDLVFESDFPINVIQRRGMNEDYSNKMFRTKMPSGVEVLFLIAAPLDIQSAVMPVVDNLVSKMINGD